MADDVAVPAAGGIPLGVPRSSQVRQWGSLRHLSSPTCWENALASRHFERMPWLAVAMLCGVLAWFGLPSPSEWLFFIGLCGIVAGGSMILIDPERFPFLRGAIIGLATVAAAGLVLAWARSEFVSAEPLGRPISGVMTFRVTERVDKATPDEMIRMLIVTEEATGAPIRARVTMPARFDDENLGEGAIGTARLRLIPPSRAIVPGVYDPARNAWFEGVSASGSVLSEVDITRPGNDRGDGGFRQDMARHVRSEIAKAGGEASAAAIAATLVTGSRAGIAGNDEQAMRDAGLAHLLSISGLHVGAVIGIIWFLAMRGLALWPWLALRVPVPIVASLLSAMGGIGYTLLTGAALPTIRACIAALLVLTALALGRQALSMRLIAIAAIVVLVFWPEAAISPSFQLSFAAVIAIVALQNVAPIARIREHARESGPLRRLLCWIGLLFLTGLVIELSLLPLVLFHFHRAGIYGAVLNLIAIPLTTFAVLPLLMFTLVADLTGLGAPFWRLSAIAIEALLDMARHAAGSPGSVMLVPTVPIWIIVTAVFGGFWLALWSGKGRLGGLVPLGLAFLTLSTLNPADLIVSGDGRHLAMRGPDGKAYLLRGEGSFAGRVLLELSGIDPVRPGTMARPLTEWPGAICNADFCFLRSGEAADSLDILVALNAGRADQWRLKRACADSDIVIAERPLTDICEPRWLKLDGRELSRRGGVTIDFSSRTIRHVRPEADRHGW